MPSDLRHELSTEAPSPSRRLYMERVWERGLQLRRRKHVLVAAVGVASVVVLVAGGLGLNRLDRNDVPPPVAATETPEHSRTPEDPEQQLVRLRGELYSQLRELRAILTSMTSQRDELLRDLESLSDAGDTEKARALERQVEALAERIAELADEIEQTQERIADVTARIIGDRRFGSSGRWIDAARGPISTGGYVFSDLELRTAPQADPAEESDRVILRGRIGFVDGYPGVRLCTWAVFDRRGDEIGAATNEFLAAGPSSGLIKDRIDVDGTPHRVGIECSEERLDNPDGRFVFTDIEVENVPSRNEFEVTTRYKWQGKGDPSAQTCEITVYEDEGEVLESAKQTMVANRHKGRLTFRVVRASGDPARATIACTPL